MISRDTGKFPCEVESKAGFIISLGYTKFTIEDASPKEYETIEPLSSRSGSMIGGKRISSFFPCWTIMSTNSWLKLGGPVFRIVN